MQLATVFHYIKWVAVALVSFMAFQPAVAEAAALHASTLSSLPAFVTGGDALLQVDTNSPVTVEVDGRAFASVPVRDGDREVQRVLIEGLREGENTVLVRAGRMRKPHRLVNHPRQGPLFSGPHQQPFLCETTEFKLPDGSTLGPAIDASCDAAVNIQFLYMSSQDKHLKPLPLGGVRPADMATTITSLGFKTDFVVRLETGVINRAIYQIAVLADPTDISVHFSQPPRQWNRRLVYAFGGGCGAAYHQGRGTAGVINNPEIGNDALAKGYAIASATLNVLGANCNDVTSAETMAMVREHFIEEFGPPAHVIGLGGSGGSMQQNLIAQNYPGLLDGLLLGRSYPDTLSVLVASSDCVLLQRYFEKAEIGWTEAQKAAVSGYPTFEHCTKAWGNYLPRWISSVGTACDSTAFLTAQEAGALASTKGRQASGLYDPQTNPRGVRCSYFDNAVNVWGQKPDGSTRWPLDNVGVTYGLSALRKGTITFEQFIDLNRRIGGFRNDGLPVDDRTRADPEALEIAYRTGRINTMSRMADIPILDVRSYLDQVVAPDVHLAYTTDVALARHVRAHGSAENFVSWTTPTLGSLREDLTQGDSPLRQAMRKALDAMDTWLSAVQANPTDLKGRTYRKPETLASGCWIEGLFVSAATFEGRNRCRTAYPPGEDPRMVAGESILRMTLKCAVRSPDFVRLGIAATTEQLDELKRAFPEGLCDYEASNPQLREAGAWFVFRPEPKSWNATQRKN